MQARPALKRAVYALEVADAHLYYANGLLVSNCDALQYLCLHADGGALFGAALASVEARPIKRVSHAGWT